MSRDWRLVFAVEVLVVALLLASWIAAVLKSRRELEQYGPVARRLLLNLYGSVDAIPVAGVVGTLVISALLLRRYQPVLTFAVVATGTAAIGWWFTFVTLETFSVEAALVVAAFWASVATDRWQIVASGAALSALVGNLRLFQVENGFVGPANRLLAILVLVGLSVGAGVLIRRVRDQAAMLAERNRELETGRAASQRAAVLGERVRIARELHDVVAHHVTAMTVHAGAARVGEVTQPVRQALSSIESSGRAAIDELHRLLGFLRSDDEAPRYGATPGTPQPSLGQLGALVESLQTEVCCSLTLTGRTEKVPTAVGVSTYRIVQEALTNTMKHSRAREVTVDIACKPDHVRVEVIDPGPPAQAAGSGHGLVGMKERVLLHEGQLEVGPNLTGWRVHAVLRW